VLKDKETNKTTRKGTELEFHKIMAFQIFLQEIKFGIG
jgi:hypothetical protein